MQRLPEHLQFKLPFLLAAFASFILSVTLYFGFDEKTMGIFVGLWVPSIHSLGTLLLTPIAGQQLSREKQKAVRGMSETAIFIIGIIVFALTVYGAVIVGGLKLTQDTLDDDDDLRRQVDNPSNLEDGLPTDVRY